MLKSQMLQQSHSPAKVSLFTGAQLSKEQAAYLQKLRERSAKANKRILTKQTYAELGKSICIKGAQTTQTLDRLFESIRNNIH
ncbi:hypothetical protein [Vibrio sonorensis]|uniref:hypothetical protein n=1 Tax=Vibrio sonorensis TaxID=1004316 RepID=UPI0008D92363|nr:hypothetical protein [Vibrio sonorensis]